MLVEAKSNLAKLMASENLFVEQRNVETAYFDLKSRVLTIPILDGNLSSELYDLLLGHEVGHALETPEKGWHDSIIDLKVDKSILNVCEDVRIEKKIKRKFPGIRISFLKGYKELLEMDFFGVKDKDLNKLNFIDRVNLYTKGGSAQGIEFTDEETVILRKIEATETFDEVVEVAKEVQELMKVDHQHKSDVKVKKKLKITIKSGGKSEESGNQQEINLEDYDEVEVVHEKAGDDEDNDEIEQPTPSGLEEYLESITDKSFRKRERSLHSQNSTEIVYSNIPELLLDNIIIGYKELYAEIERSAKAPNAYGVKLNMFAMQENFRKFRQESNKVVSYLVKEFELRKNAEQQARVQVSKTGELNMSKLHDYKFTDDIFKRMSKVPNGKSHGLVMYIDWSGSMIDHIHSTVKQLLNLSMFCRKVNIPFEVYAFSSHNKNMFGGGEKWQVSTKFDMQNPKIGDLRIKEFSLMNILSSKMNNKEFTDAASYLLDFGTSTATHRYCQNYFPPSFFTLSGTPLNQAIIASFRMVSQFKIANRLEIVNTVFLTDGEGESMVERFVGVNKYGAFEKHCDAMPTTKWRSIIRDPLTRASNELDMKLGRRSWAAMQTTALLKLLKQRLDCNVIGFYVCNSRDVRSTVGIYTTSTSSIEKSVNDFKRNNFALITDSGYDEYYLLRSESLDTDDVEFEVTSNNTRSLVNSFSKYTGGKVGSRVVLNRFINLIT